MIIFDTNERGNYRSPRNRGFRRGRRPENNDPVADWIVQNFVNDYTKKQEDEKKKKDEKKPDKKEFSASGLGMLLFLATPIVGPMYVYFTMYMLQSSLEIVKNLPIK